MQGRLQKLGWCGLLLTLDYCDCGRAEAGQGTAGQGGVGGGGGGRGRQFGVKKPNLVAWRVWKRSKSQKIWGLEGGLEKAKKSKFGGLEGVWSWRVSGKGQKAKFGALEAGPKSQIWGLWRVWKMPKKQVWWLGGGLKAKKPIWGLEQVWKRPKSQICVVGFVRLI